MSAEMGKMNEQNPPKNETKPAPSERPQPAEEPAQNGETPQVMDRTEGGDEEPRKREDGTVQITLAQYEELNTLARERDEYLKRLQRAVADYQNLQRRTEKARANLYKQTVEEVVRHILPLADSLSRALEAAQKIQGAQDILEGLKLLEKQFYDALGNFGVKPIEAIGAEFDPRFHEAVITEQQKDTPPNTVVRELKKGFMMGDRVIRPAQVSVAVAEQKEGEKEPDGKDETQQPPGEET